MGHVIVAVRYGIVLVIGHLVLPRLVTARAKRLAGRVHGGGGDWIVVIHSARSNVRCGLPGVVANTVSGYHAGVPRSADMRNQCWRVDWQDRSVQVYRRDDGQLVLATTVDQHGVLRSPLLTGFEVPVARFFRP